MAKAKGAVEGLPLGDTRTVFLDAGREHGGMHYSAGIHDMPAAVAADLVAARAGSYITRPARGVDQTKQEA